MQLDPVTEASTDRPLSERAAQISTTSPSTRLLDERQAAELLGCSVGLLRKWRRLRNTGPAFFQVGRLIRYSLPELQTFLAASRVGAKRL